MNLFQIIILCICLIVFNLLWSYLAKPSSHLDTDINHTTEYNPDRGTSTPEDNNFIKYFFTGIALFSLIGGFIGVNHWFNNYNTAKDSLNWPTFQGTILEKTTISNALIASENRDRSGRTFCPKIKYKFKYKDKTITWNKIDFLNRICSGDNSISENFINQIPNPGEPVTVYFSVERKQAVLIPGAHGTQYSGLIVTGIFFILGLVGIKFIWF